MRSPRRSRGRRRNAKVESFKRQAGLLRDNAAEAAQRRARIEAMNERRKAQAAHAQRIADDAAQVASLVAASIDDVIAKREALQAEASSHDAELKTLRAQRRWHRAEGRGLQRREHELDVDRERLAGEFGQLTQKVSDDLGLSIDELTRDFGPSGRCPCWTRTGVPCRVRTLLNLNPSPNQAPNLTEATTRAGSKPFRMTVRNSARGWRRRSATSPRSARSIRWPARNTTRLRPATNT